MKNLQALLQDITVSVNLPDVMVQGLALDSRQIRTGDLFLAYPGYKADGRSFIDQAIENGAVAILSEAHDVEDNIVRHHGIAVIPVMHLSKQVSKIVGRFYEEPSKDMLIVGITGTNGKSSCTQLLANALQLLGKKSATIGTLGYGVFGDLAYSGLTTPDALSVQSILDEFHQKDVKAVVLEASSHALAQDRVADIDFDLAIFTNLSRDHLDYHGNMEAYTRAKRTLFHMPGLRYAVLNVDDPIGRQWLHELQDHLEVCGYSVDEGVCEEVDIPLVCANNIQLTHQGLRAWVRTPWGEGVLKSDLLGQFNVSNLLAVIASLGTLGYSLKSILEVIPKLETVAGRMQTFGGVDQPTAVVDFAHTPDALRQALSALREHCKNRLICVFGCGGDRDPGKRAMMGQIAEEFADHVVVTNDNPRFEDPERIIQDILSGINASQNTRVEHDRESAIRHALENAGIGDIVLVAGKGHEKYQIIDGEKREYSDIDAVKYFLGDM